MRKWMKKIYTSHENQLNYIDAIQDFEGSFSRSTTEIDFFEETILMDPTFHKICQIKIYLSVDKMIQKNILN
uniref:Uncharacterized protein n=1 Tax=Lepeophtheirus salmonis TaxID=72036 RepID=A0A0K2SWZ6_LEPSM